MLRRGCRACSGVSVGIDERFHMSTQQSTGETSQRLAPRAVSVEAAAELLGVGRTTMFGLIRSGEVRTVTIGRRRLVPVTEVDAYVDRLRGSGVRR